MSVRDLAQELATNPKAAHLTATMTTWAGLGTVLDLIPDDIGKLATLVGIVLSLVLIRNHWNKGRAENEKIHLEIKALKGQEADRERIAELRRLAGLPVRRDEEITHDANAPRR